MKTVILAGMLGLWSMGAGQAQEIRPFDVKLGLWEGTTVTEMSGLPAMPQIPEEQLSKLPPQQRAQIEAMMKARGGVGAPRTTTAKSCLTKESLSRAMTFGANDNTCSRKVISSSSTKQEIQLDCNRNDMHMVGDFLIERVDSEHAKGTMTMKSAGGDRPINMKMSFSSKWLSSDCGDVKPVGDQ